MKNLFFFLLTLSSLFFYAQEKPIFDTIDKKKDSLYEKNLLDEQPKFPGGIAAFQSKLSSQIRPIFSKENPSLLQSVLTFDIDTDGNLNVVRVEGENPLFNKEVRRAVISISEKWTPGIYKSRPVKVRYKQPVNMKFEP